MNYIITYSALNPFGQVIKQGKMKVKNKLSELHAKSSLEDYFKKKYADFDRLIIYECKEDSVINQLLKKDNPFSSLFNDFLK
jgi:hypothetical protein